MKNFIYIFTLILTTTVFAQTTGAIDLEKAKLKQAQAYGDQSVATSSMYAIIALEGPQSSYKDSLAYMYFNARNNISCFLVTNDILSYKPENLGLIEMKAISLESMGAIDRARQTYNDLFALTNSNFHAYKISTLLFAMGKNDEAHAMIKQADQLPDDGTLEVTFQVNKNYNQNVSLKASIAYVEGLIALELEKKAEARENFEKAIALFPDFVLAKSKLTTLDSPEEK